MNNKSHRIKYLVKYLQDKYGKENVVINDYWQADFHAIGLTNEAGLHLAYLSITNNENNKYYLALENPSVNGDSPYSPSGYFDNISLTELEGMLIKHLDLLVIKVEAQHRL